MVSWKSYKNKALRQEGWCIFIEKISNISCNKYKTENTVKIVNTRQAGLYIKNNIPLVDLFWSQNTLVFVFNREESKGVYDLWCKRELK